MNQDIKTYVVNLLETCQERKQKIALLHYELKHPAQISEIEMINAMALGHGNSGSGHTDGHVSDKTLYIALNYQNRVEKLNTDTREEIAIQSASAKSARILHHLAGKKASHGSSYCLF